MSQEMDASLRRAINKAVKYLEEGRVVPFGDRRDVFYVISKERRHLVRVKEGRITCSCDGFKARGFCSHALAVWALLMMDERERYLEEKIRDRLAREIRRLRSTGDFRI